jgi:hypothetical protein
VKKLTRRSFLQRAPVTAATLSVLPAMPALAAIRRPPQASAHGLPATSPGSMVIHVNDVAKGEMTLLVGARQVVLCDPRLVAHFIEAAR